MSADRTAEFLSQVLRPLAHGAARVDDARADMLGELAIEAHELAHPQTSRARVRSGHVASEVSPPDARDDSAPPAGTPTSKKNKRKKKRAPPKTEDDNETQIDRQIDKAIARSRHKPSAAIVAVCRRMLIAKRAGEPWSAKKVQRALAEAMR